MNKLYRIQKLALLGAALLVSASLLQPVVSLSNTSDPDQEIRAVIDAFFEAADRRDWEATGKLMSEDFVIFIDGGESFGKQEYVELLGADDLVVESLELRDMEISVSADASMAWSRYKADVASVSNGERHDVSTLETLVFDKAGDTWLIRHAHVALAPYEPNAKKAH